MECFLQYWDNLDDLYFAVAAQRERWLSLLEFVVALTVIGAAALAGFFSARYAPEDAVVISVLLTLFLMAGSTVKRLRSEG